MQGNRFIRNGLHHKYSLHLENKIWLGVVPYIIGHESVTLMDSSYILVKCYLPIKSMQPWVVQPEVEKNFQGRALESGRKPSSWQA